jgi:lipoyl-dependent peroxiredoxin
MPVRNAEAIWDGDLSHGQGQMKLGSGAFEGRFSFGTRMGEEPGTNPEELLGAAEAGCYSMALAASLIKAGYTPQRIHTTAAVHLDKAGEGFKITKIRLHTEATVPDLDTVTFDHQAHMVKQTCPVSQALAGTPIELEARLTTEPIAPQASQPEKGGGQTDAKVPSGTEQPKEKEAAARSTRAASSTKNKAAPSGNPPLHGDAVL